VRRRMYTINPINMLRWKGHYRDRFFGWRIWSLLICINVVPPPPPSSLIPHPYAALDAAYILAPCPNREEP